LDNLLAGDFIRPCPAWLNALFALALAVAAAVANRFAATGARSGAVFAAMLPAPLLAALGACAGGYWLEAAPAATAVALALVASSLVNYALEGRQKRFIKDAFRQYLSPAVIEQLVRNPDSLRLGGETRELTLLFSDIQGFTSLSEKLTPEKLTALLNDYLTAMSDIIMEEGGTVDKYEGDAIIAFWNAPLDLPSHAEAAVRAALRCQQKLAELRPEFRERCGRDLFARIGINTGPVVIGNMGSRQRFNYTFLGDAGNLASRLEGVNKQFGTSILISESTRAKLGGGFACREVGRVRVVGRQAPITVFEPMTSRPDFLAAFEAGLQAWYHGDFAEAARRFEMITGVDPAARAYLARCAGTKPEHFDGVWQMTEK
jgi:adenylate cyclase